MSIDKLGSASGIIAALRAEMSERKERPGSRAAPNAGSTAAASTSRDPKVLRKQLVEIVRPVSLDDPEAVKAVRSQVFRAILLWEFGPALRDHPDWQPMLQSITTNLADSPIHQAQFLTLLSELKR